MPAEPFLQPPLKTIERPWPPWLPVGDKPAHLHITLHRMMAAAELPAYPLRPPAEPLQPQHRRDLLRRLHPLTPRIINPQSKCRDSLLLHTLPRRITRGQFLVSSGGSFPCRPTRQGRASKTKGEGRMAEYVVRMSVPGAK